MRYTWIDGIFVEVKCCARCPFYSTEMECAGYCQYPVSPANSGAGFDYLRALKHIMDDCPLRRDEEERI